jgi:transcriptional regulator with XRE-family HTH domain
MRAIPTGRLLRMLRIRKDWRQSDVAGKAELSPAVIARHEGGIIGSLTALERHAGVFGLRIDVRLVGRSGELVRLADEEHAAIVETLATWFRSVGFLVEAEASFSEWGERGRIDLLAFDPETGTLVVVEVKTQLLDLQDLFGALNVKERLGATVAERRGWSVRRRMSVLGVADTSANRGIVRQHPSLFASFARRRLTASAVRGGEPRLLHWVSAPRASRGAWIAGRRRARRSRVRQFSSGEANHENAPQDEANMPISLIG